MSQELPFTTFCQSNLYISSPPPPPFIKTDTETVYQDKLSRPRLTLRLRLIRHTQLASPVSVISVLSIDSYIFIYYISVSIEIWFTSLYIYSSMIILSLFPLKWNFIERHFSTILDGRNHRINGGGGHSISIETQYLPSAAAQSSDQSKMSKTSSTFLICIQ